MRNESQTRTSGRTDHLVKLVNEDIPRDQARLKGQTNVDVGRVMTEISGTVFEYFKDLARQLMDVREKLENVRDWSYQSMNAISDHLEATDERLGILESFSDDTTLLPEDAEILAKVSVGCKYLAGLMLTGPFPITERDPEGKQKLVELMELCDQADKIINDTALIDEDDEDNEDEDEDETEGAELEQN